MFRRNLSVIILILSVSSPVLADGNIYTAYDSNGDGFLDKTEFANFIEKRHIKDAYRHLWVFEDVDLNDDKLISNNELVLRLQEEIKLRTRLKRQ